MKELTATERAKALHAIEIVVAKGHGLGPRYSALLIDELKRLERETSDFNETAVKIWTLRDIELKIGNAFLDDKSVLRREGAYKARRIIKDAISELEQGVVGQEKPK